MFIYQFVMGTQNLKVNKFNNDKIVVTCNLAEREDNCFLWGAETYYLKMCRELSKYYEVHLFQKASGVISGENIINHTNIENYFSKDNMKKVALKIKTVAPRCILCNAGAGQQAMFWTIISKITGVPIIMFFHNEPTYIKDTMSIMWGMDYIRKQKIFETPDLAYDMVLRNCDRLAFLLPQYVDEKYKDKSYVYYNCIDLPENVDIQNERDNILYVGRINKNVKRTQLLLDYVKDTNYPCEVLGHSYYDADGFIDMSYYEQFSNINFQGYRKNVGDYYRKAKVLVIPSLYEGLPTVAIEALSYGVPIIGFKECKSMNDIIIDGYNGWIVDQDLGATIDKVMQLKDMSDIRKNCITEAKKYDINCIIKTIIESIESLV